MEIFLVLLMSIALSIDGLGVGLAYGMKEIKIKIKHILLIAVSAAVVMGVSILFGKLLNDFIPNHFEKIIGGGLLILIGIWHFMKGWKDLKLNKINLKDEEPILLELNIKCLGIILKVLAHPTQADIDNSGDINFKEALLLGIALNIDAFASGIGAGIAGYSIYLIPLIGLFLFFAIELGIKIGNRLSVKNANNKGSIYTGIILFCLGCINLL